MRAAASVLLLAVLALVLAACGDDGGNEATGSADTAGETAAAETTATESVSTIRLAVTDLTGLEELQREFGAFVDAIETETGFGVELFPVNDRAAAAAALGADRVDLVFTGPAEYVVMKERVDVEPVVAINRPGYRACVYTTADSEFDELADLEGRKVAMSDVGSTSGHLAPSQIFTEAGFDMPGGVEVLTVGDAVHPALKRGDVDAAGVGCHDYEEAVAAEDDPSQFRVIAEGELLPPDIIVARSGFSAEAIETIRTAFDENWEQVILPAMLAGKDNQKYDGATLITVPSDSDYDVVRSMYESIGVDDFSEFVGS